MEIPKVIQLKPVISETTFTISRSSYCVHENVEVDVDEREIRCQSCNAVVDAFAYVLSMANEERRHWNNLQNTIKEVKSLQETKERLEKDVNNLKASKRRMQA